MPRLARPLLWKLLVFLVLASSLGCTTTATLDLRNIDEPVMLNALPYGEPGWTVEPLEKIRASALTDRDYFSWGSSTWSSASRENKAETTVYEKIGGHASQAISNGRIEIGGFGVNLLPVLSSSRIKIDLYGDVVDLGSKADEAAPPESGAAPPATGASE